MVIAVTPAAAAVGCAAVTGRFHTAAACFYRLLIDAAFIIALGGLVL